MAHTPGPWSVHSEMPNRIILNGSHSYDVECRTGDEPSHNADDVRLIAAAPDLLAACRQWLAFYDKAVRQDCFGDEPGISEMRAAVSKAKGGHE